ncbi:retron St85 family effector protein [Bradyrhizobium sp. HKCCYLS3013]|uniref:retron St85 family effector protein n=1 Tax=Bradyrhizobium sp. HKCCYLS3013 TaxID=3420735 RepID=UPI003EB84319
MLPYAEDLDANRIHVQVPTNVIFLCGGPISSLSEPIPLSLRDAFYKIIDNPILRERELMLAEDITSEMVAFDKYKNILELETDLAQIVELIILFCESEGSLAELGAFAVINEIAKRLFVVVREKHWEALSFIKLGPLRLIENQYGRESIYVVDDDDIGMRGNSASAVNPAILKDRLLVPLTVRLEKPREPTTFDATRSGHVIKLIVGLVQEYGALQQSEISHLLQILNVSQTTDEAIQRYLFCAEKVEWLKRVSKGAIDYFVALAKADDAAVIHSKASAKEKHRPRRRLLIREHWQKTDQQRFRAISQVARGVGA